MISTWASQQPAFRGGGGAAFNNASQRYGRATLANSGAVPASHPAVGILGTAPAPASWTFTKTAGGAKWPSPVTGTNTPQPTSNLDNTDAGAVITYDISADGVPTGKVLTITVQSLAEASPAYTISNKTNATALKTPLNAASGTRRVELQTGSDAAWSNVTNRNNGSGNPDIMYLPGYSPTSECIFTSSNPANQTKVGKIRIIGGNNLTFQELAFRFDIPSQASTGASNATQRALQAVAMLGVEANASFGRPTNIKIQNCSFGPLNEATTDVTQHPTAVAFSGTANADGSLNMSLVLENGLIDNNYLFKVQDGIGYGHCKTVTISNNIIDQFCYNALIGGGSILDTVTISGNIVTRPRDNSVVLAGSHYDFCQIGSINNRANAPNFVLEKNIFAVLDASFSAQGVFFNDVAFNGSAVNSGWNSGVAPGGESLVGKPTQYASGWVFTNSRINNNLYSGASTHGVTVDGGTGWEVYNNTAVMPSMPNFVGNSGAPILRAANEVSSVTSTPIQAQGTYKGNVVHNAPGSNILNSPADPSNIFMGTTGLPTIAPRNEAQRQAFYAAFFSTYDNTNWLPLVGGPLDLGSGKFAGWKNPDGSWADAR